MKRSLLFAALFMALAEGCTSSAGSCAASSGTLSYCVEITGGNANADNTRSLCTGASGTYSSGACATANRVGRCNATTTTGGTSLTTVTSVYSPATAEQGMALCTLLMGTWTPN